MGKTETAEERREKHAGAELAPPCTPERVEALGPLQPRDVGVEGGFWDRSTVDIAIAGLGWVAIGCKGAATFRAWAPAGVAITTHDAMVPDFAKDFERPGFSRALPLAKAVKDLRARGDKEGQIAAAAARKPAAAAAARGSEQPDDGL